MKKSILMTTAALLLGSGGAGWAQMDATPTQPLPVPSIPAPALQEKVLDTNVQQSTEVDANRLIGRNVQNAQDQSIGQIKSVMIGADGKVSEVIIGVGGFLGVGEREVAIAWSDLIMVNDKLSTRFTKAQLEALPEYKYADMKLRGTVFPRTGGTLTAQAPVPQIVPVPAPALPVVPAPSINTGVGLVTATKLVGLDVRGPGDDIIGTVKDVVVGDDGAVKSAILAVGGFLGIGQRHVALTWNQLAFQRAANDELAVRVSLSADQLKALPEYKLENGTWMLK